MDESVKHNEDMEPDTQDMVSGSLTQPSELAEVLPEKPADNSESMFPDSPVYEPDEDPEFVTSSTADSDVIEISSESKDEQLTIQSKRKLSDDSIESNPKIQKLDLTNTEFAVSTQSLDDEVSEITTNAAKLKNLDLPSTSRVRTPIRSSPRLLKRSNSADISQPKPPKTPKSRPASVDVTERTPRKVLDKETSVPKLDFIKGFQPKVKETIAEENSEVLDDSQGFTLHLSPGSDEEDKSIVPGNSSSDPVAVKDRQDVLDPGQISQSRSEGFKYSDQNDLSQPIPKAVAKTTDQESTDSMSSNLDIESPEHIPSVASKMISKLSNGTSSTPTELPGNGKHLNDDSDCTPDMIKLLTSKGKRAKNESFRVSNNTTPSTISPLQNGHSLPLNTPQIPVFDVHVSHNEDNEFLSLYIVRTDNDVGMDMCKEYQRISKRFTMDPYAADVSVNTSPSSVTSGGMINLPNRTSFASTVSSTSTSSNRTSDGNFVVPQPPRKSVANPTTSVKGYDALIKKLQDIFSYIRDNSVDDANRSINQDKVSVGVQVSVSSDGSVTNGNASPEEMSKCDKATPKSSLKKSRVRGRRHLAGKTKRAILPTQTEEPDYMHGMNSPEMIPTNGENGKESPNKSPKDEKPLSTLVATPKSVSKLKQKRRPTSPRPATPVEKAIIKTEYPGYPPETVVLAKWVDKRYYSGKVLEITELNKYLIKFDDGQSKVLLDEFIIFGDTKVLPLEGQSVYAVVDEEQTYEPGLVMGVDINDSGTVTYRCITDGDTTVMVTASELYLTEDQARSLKESINQNNSSSPSTPRRRAHRELDLDNIIQGPRSARSRDKGTTSSARKRIASPKSPKASTSGVKTKTPIIRPRLASESSSMSESSNSAPPARLEEVAGVEPEVQKTPRKVDGVKAGPFQLKGLSKQNVGKKNSKLTKFENDSDTVSVLGPIPVPGEHKYFAGLHFLLTCADTPKRKKTEKSEKNIWYCDGTNLSKQNVGKKNSKLTKFENDSDTVSVLDPIPVPGEHKYFAGLHFLLTCADTPKRKKTEKSEKESRHYSSEEDSEAASASGTDAEDLVFCDRPFHKERLREQLEAAGGVVHSHFDEVPKNKYSVCKLIAPRPCLTAKYIQCLASNIRAVSHAWVIISCGANELADVDAHALPAGWSISKRRFINWLPRNANFFKDKLILFCGDQDTFVRFWERTCTLAGANTRVVNEDDLNMSGAIALVTDWDCPHEVQNKANEDNIPIVSTTWVVQCLIEARVVSPTSNVKFSFMYTEPE